MTNHDNQPTLESIAPETEQAPAREPGEPATIDLENSKESPPAAPGLLMFNAGEEGACTADGCVVTFPNVNMNAKG